MCRQPRLILPSQPQHIIQRGNNRDIIFACDDERQSNYRGLFDSHIDARDLDDIRHATNKSWVLGTDRFKEQVEALTQRQTQPKAKGGDRKSKQYHESKENKPS